MADQRYDLDQALCQAQTIALPISYLGEVNNLEGPPASTFGWLAEELNARLERIEGAEMAMRQAVAGAPQHHAATR